jgi:hypothetical protein
MAKFNDYSRFAQRVEVIPFEFLGETFKVKNTQWNLLKVAEAQKATQEASQQEEIFRAKLEEIQEQYGEDIPDYIQEEINKEQVKINELSFKGNETLQNCIKTILGDTQYSRLQKLDISTETYGVLILIIFGLVSGLSHKDLMEQLEKNAGSMGEQKPQNKPNNKKHKK